MADHSELWVKYKQTRDPLTREKLVLAYAPLVKYVAGRLAMGMPPQIELSDLESYGLFGLLEAIDRFDPLRGNKFQTYAMMRVRGAIIDGLRAESWAPALKNKARQIETAYADLETTLGRTPSDEELAGHLGLTKEELRKREQEVAAAILISFDDPLPSVDGMDHGVLADMLPDHDSPDPVYEAMQNELRGVLMDAIEKLPDKERLVVTLFYYEGLTSKEIAAVMSLSIARISQLHSKAILRLRGHLAKARRLLIG